MKQLLLFAYLFSFGLTAQNTIFNPETSKGKLYEYSDFVDVGKSDLTVNQILKDSKLKFEPLVSENQSVGFTSDNYWVRFQLENSSDQFKIYYLETARPI